MTRRWIVVALLCGATLAQAQSPTKKDLVAKLIALQQPALQNLGTQIAAQNAQRVLQAAARALPRVAADKREAVGKDVQADVKRFFDEVNPILRDAAGKQAQTTVGPLYEQRFTEDELKQIIAWVESPVSGKFQQFDADASKALVEKVLADSRGTVEPKLKTLEASVAKRLAVPGDVAGAPASAPARK